MKPNIPGRWHAQGLDVPRWDSGVDVVRHLGAVQSQLHDMALWAVGRRCGRTLTELQQEFDELQFRRTHVLRPTWHYVAPEDLGWLQQATADRVERLSVSSLKQHGITAAQVDSAVDVIGNVVADGNPHLREELREALVGAGLNTAANAVAHYAMSAEVRLVMANGPMIGKQHSYLALPKADHHPLTADEALAPLATRYARGHGPIRAKDLAWWSSITLTQARRAIELAELTPIAVDGDEYWRTDEALDDAPPARAALLSNFDEYISYARDAPDYLRVATSTQDEVMRSTGLLFIDGALSGLWRRAVKSTSVQVAVASQVPLTTPLRHAIEHDAERFAQFLNTTLDLVVTEA